MQNFTLYRHTSLIWDGIVVVVDIIMVIIIIIIINYPDLIILITMFNDK